ncbi:hypothetical protein [Alcaligenes sp. SDU_A2]|uniref:hypothetical protein n=1 Tax=Alcaligenes sp. SDU_A2 TaxID=3136634 RepID=UPI00311F4819
MTRRILVALLLSIPLTACQTLQGGGMGGEDKFTASYARTHLKEGVTSVEDVRRIYGPPHSVDEGPTGPTMWVYRPDENNPTSDLLSTAMNALGAGAISTAAPTKNRVFFVHFERNKVSSYSLQQ